MESAQTLVKALLAGRLLTRHEVSQTLQAHDVQPFMDWGLNEATTVPGITGHVDQWQCQRCGNQNQKDFAHLPDQHQTPYCLACLNMGRISQTETLYTWPQWELEPIKRHVSSYLTWQGSLSSEQARVARELVESLAEDRPHLVYAVTGAGKTEMLFPLINQVLMTGGRVALASPRIDVVLELFPRLQQAFGQLDICLLHGKQTECYQPAALVLATTHQLLRFQAAFDLLIIDEVDAFPYVNNRVLHFASRRAVKATGKTIYLTATPDDTLKQQVEQGQLGLSLLPARYHGYALPVPRLIWIGDWRASILAQKAYARVWFYLKKFLQLEGIKLIFMPDIQLAEALFEWLCRGTPQLRLAFVHAKDPQRINKVTALRQGQLDALITTTILERGVTFKHCHVFVIGAEHPQFTASALVQMAGRVGRHAAFPNGTLWYGCYGKSAAIVQAVCAIKQMNTQAKANGLIAYE